MPKASKDKRELVERSGMRSVLAALMLYALALVAYAPAIPGKFIWDDDDYVTRNPNLRHDQGLAHIWFHPRHNPQYYPLVFTNFWLEWRLWGEDPSGYHVVNILLHATSAVLLWRLLRKLEVPGACLAAAIFAVHPVMVESVAWVTERKNTLSLVFYLGAMHAYLRFAGTHTDADNPRSWRPYALALTLFVCALLSKTVTATLPAAILLILWWKRGRIDWRHAALLAPFFALGILAGLHTGYLERTHVGAKGPEWDWSVIDRILIAGRAVWFYAAKLIAPINLSFIYPKWTIDPSQWWQWIFPLALVAALAILFALRYRIGRGPIAAVLFFVGTLVPALGFVNVFPMRYAFVADHFQYHASIGLIAPFAAAVAVAAAKCARPPLASSRVQLFGGGALVLTLSTLTFLRAQVFRSPERIWQDTLAKNPNSWMTWMNTAHLATARGDHAAAAQAYRKAHALAPQIIDTRYQLALVKAREGQIDAAIADLQEIVSQEPGHANAHHQLARLLRRQGKLPQAAVHLESALAIQPNNLDILRELADVQIKQANYSAAEPHLRRILEVIPNDPDTLFDLATLLALTNRREEAAALYGKALQLKPELRRRLPR